MNLIFIYGPPAAGKLTVAEELGKKLGYRVFKNHTLVGCVADVFPFGDENLEPVLKKLTVKFRLEIYEEAAKNAVSLVTTYGGGGTKRFKFFSNVKNVVEKQGGNVFFIQLLPTEEELMKRVTSKSRIGVKIDNIDYLKKQLRKHPEFKQKYTDVEHLTIDNSKMTPKEVSEKIIEYYKLS
jgi:cytidylate kinase